MVAQLESALRKPTTWLQASCCVIAHICAFVSLVLVFKFALGDRSKEYMGGFNSKEKTFNYHPVMMVMGTIFFSAEGTLAFRSFSFGKPANKIAHGVFQAAAIVCTTFGVITVFTSHNSKEHSQSGAYSPNLYTCHGWLGIGTITLYYFQWATAIAIYAYPRSLEFRTAWMPLHVSLGNSALVGAAACVASGVAEFCAWHGVNYHISGDKAVLNPSEYYHDISEGFRVGMWLAVFSFLTVMFSLAAINDSSVPQHFLEDEVLSSYKSQSGSSFPLDGSSSDLLHDSADYSSPFMDHPADMDDPLPTYPSPDRSNHPATRSSV